MAATAPRLRHNVPFGYVADRSHGGCCAQYRSHDVVARCDGPQAIVSEPNATILMRERRAENREMPTAGNFTPEEMAATVRTEILRALKAAAVSTEVDRRGLLPAHIILSARLVDS